MDEDTRRVIEHVANIPDPQFHNYIITSMPKEIIDAAKRVRLKSEQASSG